MCCNMCGVCPPELFVKERLMLKSHCNDRLGLHVLRWLHNVAADRVRRVRPGAFCQV